MQTGIMQGKYRVLSGVTQACKHLVTFMQAMIITPHGSCQLSSKHSDYSNNHA